MDPSKFKVTQLKEQLKEQKRQLLTTGNKTELIVRLQEADPEGYWMQEAETCAASLSGNNAVDENVPAPTMSQKEMLRELEWLRREQRLLQRELQLAERENQILRNSNRENRPEMQAKVNVKVVEKLLSEFDGLEGLF